MALGEVCKLLECWEIIKPAAVILLGLIDMRPELAMRLI
jgi:hypothetical protein